MFKVNNKDTKTTQVNAGWDAIQWVIHVKDTTYKKSFTFFFHGLQLCLPVKLAVIFATETWTTCF